jgi:uncharacterized protein
VVIYDMTPEDCRKMLQQGNFGRLACANANQPYIVPIYFVYQREYLYSFSSLGQKITWMRSNPTVCVQMDQLTSGEQWSSVVVTGRYEELPDIAEWQEEVLEAYELIRKRALWWQPSYASAVLRDSSQAPTPVHYRIHADQVSGRRAFPSTAEAAAEGYGTAPL